LNDEAAGVVTTPETTTMRTPNRTILTTSSLLAMALLAGCSRKDEAPAPAETVSGGATAPAGATADEWAWADGGTRPPGPTVAPASPLDSRDVEDSRPVASAPRATAPRSTAPRATAPRGTNEFEKDVPYGDDRPATASAPPAKVAYTAPAGASIEVRLDTALDSATATVGQAVSATLDSDLTDGAGHVILPRGTRLSGTVTEAVSARKVQKKSVLAYQLTSAQLPDGTTVAIAAGQRVEGKGYTKKDGAIIGGSAAGGAVLGQVLGGDTESTAVGAIVGGAIGSGVALSKKGEDVQIAAGTIAALSMERPVTVER
jgi:hypothetical protein